jgi:hypothetical protein
MVMAQGLEGFPTFLLLQAAVSPPGKQKTSAVRNIPALDQAPQVRSPNRK